jgi:hypothetical protein
VPPSYRRSTGEPYLFVQGSWDDLDRLPAIKPGALSMLDQPTSTGATPRPLHAIREGARNNTLTRSLASHLARRVTDVETEAELVEIAREFNTRYCDPPDHDRVVVKTARSIWRYKLEGRIWELGGEAHVHTGKSVFDKIMAHDNGAEALALDLALRFAHGARHEPFAVSPRAMARDGTIPGWSEYKYRNARSTLVDAGRLILVRKGGSRDGDASKFRFPERQAK